MKISYQWLKEYIEIDKTPEQLADDLSLFGHEAESVEKMGNDYILDLEITPNRGDCLSILGIAREISAMYNTNLKYSTSQLTSIAVTNIDKNIEVKIEKPEICPRFTARIIDNIKIGDSPKWMQEKLATYGFRPINNIVDITNYVMVANGQPLHAFDYDKIKDGLMNIRQATQGEEVMTLDGQNRILPKGAIIIEDSEKIYDLAGIMGGIKSEVDKNTKTIILQGAIFDPVLIRKTSKELSHVTDASYRYERGVDYESTILGVNLAASLIKELLPEAKIGLLIDKVTKKQPDINIDIDLAKINKLLGTNIVNDDANDYLDRLGFNLEENIITVPSFRFYDVKIWQDIAEEIARIYGYNKIEKRYFEKETSDINKEFVFREAIKDFLAEIGFNEVYSYSFIDKNIVNLIGLKVDDIPQIEKPLSPETEYLKPNLLVSVLAQIAKNPWSPEANVFEIEKVFKNDNEWWQLCMAITGKNEYIINKALKKLKINSQIIQVDQKILDYLKIRRQVKYVLVNIDEIPKNDWNYKNNISSNKYNKISKYPPTVRDLSLIFDSDTKEEDVIKTIKSVSEKIFITELFDTYHMDNNKKNLAFHIWMQDMSGPMDEKEVEEIIKITIEKISNKYQAELRKK